MEHILLIGTRTSTLDSLSEMIRSCDYELSIARNQRAALDLARCHRPDLIIIDNTSIRLAGSTLSHALRRLLDVPLIAIVRERKAFEATNNTHLLVKPYTANQLLQCIRRALQYPRDITCGPLKLDLRKRWVYTPSHDLPQRLPPKQFALLRLLMQQQGRIVTREMVMAEVWETEFMDDTRTLDVHIRWLREKIEANPSDPCYLHTVRGKGYCLECDDEELFER
ncbi:MAG: response regulator transcription factor [Chloroflexota bacterium]|nr:response regulator transcription factor [Chloroflexota bacterium]